MHGPTPFPDVNDLLNALLTGAQAVLGSDLVGLYLHGSLALGDFDPFRSDVDFLAVTREALPPERVSALAAMHAAVAGSGLSWAGHYEGSYIPRRALRNWRPARHPALDAEGRFGMDEHGSAWVIQRHILREHGIALTGPSPFTLLDPVSPDELRLATAAVLDEWWKPQLENPVLLRSSEYQAYAVLTMCRALYTLEQGAIATKPRAARWALERLDPAWAGLIEAALAWRRGAELDRLNETLDFIRCTIQR